MERRGDITLAEKLDIENEHAQKSGHKDRFGYKLKKTAYRASFSLMRAALPLSSRR